MIEEIRERLPLYEATITDNLHYQMVEDISSLLILFDAQNKAIENRIKELETELDKSVTFSDILECRFRIDELKNLLK